MDIIHRLWRAEFQNYDEAKQAALQLKELIQQLQGMEQAKAYGALDHVANALREFKSKAPESTSA